MGRIVGGANGLSSGLVGGKSYQRFTASGDWIKPAGASFITFEMIGAGGGGGGSVTRKLAVVAGEELAIETPSQQVLFQAFYL